MIKIEHRTRCSVRTEATRGTSGLQTKLVFNDLI